MRLFITAKTVEMCNHLNSTFRNINPDLFTVHVGKNDNPVSKTNNEVAEDIVIKKNSGFDAISDIFPRVDNYKTKSR